MTSEPDSPSRRRPPTIDLTAKEVEPEKPSSDAGTDSASNTAPPSRADRLKAHGVGAIVGAAAMAVIGLALWVAGYMPPHDDTAPPAAAAQSAADKTTLRDEIAARLEKIETAIKTPLPDAALANRLTAEETQTRSLSSALTALAQRVDAASAAAQNAAALANAASASAEAAKNTAQPDVQRNDIDTLSNHIAALERAVKLLSDNAASHASGIDDRALRLTVAAQALDFAVERGAPYQNELATAKSLGVDQNVVAPLDAFATTGVPSTAMLAHELTSLIPALWQAADIKPVGGTLIDRLEASAHRLVRITPVDARAGDDPPSVIARINADAARTDIAAALSDIAKLPDPIKSRAADWIQKAQARDAAIAASRHIAADTLAALAKPNTQ